MSDLTRNFSSREFACKHCGALRLDPALPAALQALRDLAGRPIIVLSGYRCPDHPEERRKTTPGMHAQGKAADVLLRGHTLRRAYDLAAALGLFGGIGIYDGGFLHLDLRPTPARWGRLAGVYVPFSRAAAILFPRPLQ